MTKYLKSKTINFNVLAGAIVPMLSAFGVAVDPTLITSILVIANIILRRITKEPLSAK